jgi:hypothetical protein
MKKTAVLFIVGAVMVVGCNSGDTPIETVKTTSTPATAGTSGAAAPSNVGSAIQGNSNMPQAAKEALLGKGN